MEILKHVQWVDWKTKIIDITYDVTKDTLETALDRICQEAYEATQVSCLFTSIYTYIFFNGLFTFLYQLIVYFYRININSLF